MLALALALALVLALVLALAAALEASKQCAVAEWGRSESTRLNSSHSVLSRMPSSA